MKELLDIPADALSPRGVKHFVQGLPLTAARRRDLWTAQTGRTVSWLGDEVTTVALLLLVAPRGSAAVGAVLVVAAVPFVVLSAPAGRLADRHDSRVLTVLTAGVGAVGLLGMAMAARAGAPLGVLLGLFGAVQCAAAVAGPTWSALLPRIVGPDRAAGSAGTSQTLRSAAVLVGLPAGGLLVGVLGAAGAFAVDAATFALLAVASAGITTRRWVAAEHRTSGAPATVEQRTAGRLRAVIAEPVLGPLLVVLAAFVLAGTAANVAEVLLVTQVLGGGPVAFGASGAVVGAGLVAGSLLARLVRTDRTRVAGTCAAALVLGVLITAEGLAPSLQVLFVLLAVNGVTNGVLNCCFGQVVVTRPRDHERGRVAATVSGVLQAAGVLGLPIGAVLAAAAGPRGAHVVCGVAAVVLTLATTAVSSRRLVGAVGVGPPAGEAARLTVSGHGTAR